ncbi:Uncharacterised protein g7709 [Pycnogonum litorale]
MNTVNTVTNPLRAQPNGSSPSPLSLKIAQLNVGKSRLATDNLFQSIVEDNFDILFITEPYTMNNLVDSFPGCAIFQSSSHETRVKSAIVVPPGPLTFSMNNTYDNENVICVQTIVEGNTLSFISAYFEPQTDIQTYLCGIDAFVSTLQNTNNVLICMDSNCKSSTWGSETTDERGETLDLWTAQHGLLFANIGAVPTFSSHQEAVSLI